MSRLMIRIILGALCMAPALAVAEAAGTPLDLSPAAEPGFFGMFSHLPAATKEFDGIAFNLVDARVRVPAGEKRKVEFAPVTGAAVHFLHFTESAGSKIGAYILHYADGERVEIPLQSGLNIHDWWKPGALAFGSLVHRDEIETAEKKMQGIGFWRFTVQNPRPAVALTGLEVVNSDAAVTINLIAASVTPSCGESVADVPVWMVGMEEEQFFLAMLKQKGAAAGKENACENLRRVGTLKSVPAIAALLTDEKLSQAARLALGSMAYPEAHAALRDALDATSGAIRAGIIETLGTRRDPADVRLLAPCLSDKDPVVVMSAALALGRIGGPKAVAALKQAAAKNTGRVRMVALDSLLKCAEAMAAQKPRAANKLYSQIYKNWSEGGIGTAAYRGMMMTGRVKTVEKLLADALLGGDPDLLNAAIPAVRDIKEPAITQSCANLLSRAPHAILPDVLWALAQRGDRAATPAIVPFVADGDPAVSAAAIKALALIGNGTAVGALVKAAAQGEGDNPAAALGALVQLDAPDVAEALLAQLKGSSPAETAIVAKVLGQRGDKAVVPALRALFTSQEPAVRMAAAQALGEIGGAEDAELLCQAVERAQSDKERAAVKRALIAMGTRLDTPAEAATAIAAHTNAQDPAARCAMLGVCGALRNPQLLQALDAATRDADPDVKEAAVRALAESPNPAALSSLWALLENTGDLAQRVLIFRGIARLASSAGVDDKTREDALVRGLAAAERPDEKKLFLGALGKCPTPGALKAVEQHLPSDEVVAEAVIVWAQIAQPLLASHADDIRKAAPAVAARAKEAGLSKASVKGLADVMRALAAAPVAAERVHFDHTVIDPQFRSEGVAVADVNADGVNDIIAGDLWYEAPAWQQHEIRPVQTYDPATGYSRCFANFTTDIDGDTLPDSIVVGFPGGPAHWYRNPGAAGGHWQEYLLSTAADNETPLFVDLLGDGKPVPVFGINTRAAWFRPGQDITAPWLAHTFSHPIGNFAHGLGVGDLNKDGRMDVLYPEGWWEGPLDPNRPDWNMHTAKLGPACANMLVYDVDADGDNDVISSSAHDYGIWWFEQRQGEKDVEFVQHEIDKSFSQTHAILLADINNDGLMDFVTGKRYYAHCGHDPGAEEPVLLCWYELQRTKDGVAYRKHVIDTNSGVGTQFELCDFDADGLTDIVTSNKKGVHVFVQRRSK